MQCTLFCTQGACILIRAKKEAAQEDSSVLHCIPSSTMHEICTQDKRDMVKYVDISQAGNPNSYNRSMMTWCLC